MTQLQAKFDFNIKQLFKEIEQVFLQEKQLQNSETVQAQNNLEVYNLYSKLYSEFLGKYPDPKSILSFISSEKKNKYSPKVLVIIGDPANDT